MDVSKVRKDGHIRLAALLPKVEMLALGRRGVEINGSSIW